MEEYILNYDGEIKHSDSLQQTEIIQQDEFFDVSILDAIRFCGEDYEKRVDALLYSEYVSNPQDGETIGNTTMEYWLIV